MSSPGVCLCAVVRDCLFLVVACKKAKGIMSCFGSFFVCFVEKQGKGVFVGDVFVHCCFHIYWCALFCYLSGSWQFISLDFCQHPSLRRGRISLYILKHMNIITIDYLGI